MMVFENVWASRLGDGVVNANGRLVENVRVPADIVQAATQQQMAQQQAALAREQTAEAQAGSSFDEQLVQIQKLSVMKYQGLITEEEFAAKKAQILGI
jgi:regulator of protease activity HflC (stomatin/prohibitin superfamily)